MQTIDARKCRQVVKNGRIVADKEPFQHLLAILGRFMPTSTWIFENGTDQSRCPSRCHSGFGSPGPNPLADMDPLSRIWTPLKTSVLLSKIGKIVFGAVKEAK